MSSARSHRVDPPDTEVPLPARPLFSAVKRRQAADRPGTGRRVDSSHRANSSAAESIDTASGKDWLRLHGTDLVDRLRRWAADLDAREAQLNARSSLQDHRERRFRLHQHDVATDLAEQRQSIERLRREIQAQARRLAFSSDSPTES